MSIYTRPPHRMPQPEQWMSEHPFIIALAIAAVIALVVVFA